MTRSLVALVLLWIASLAVFHLRGPTMERTVVAGLPAWKVGTGEPTVLASHGGMASKETLLHICAEVARRNGTCVAVDLPGHGENRSPAFTAPNPGCRDARTALRAAWETTPGKSGFIGHSYGAHLGCEAGLSPGAFIGARCAKGSIWGNWHRSLGTDAELYALSHVTEPWDPRVVDQAVARTLRTGRRVPPPWGRFGLMGLGLLTAFGASAGASSVIRGRLSRRQVPGARLPRLAAPLAAAAGAAVWIGIVSLSLHANLWWPWPTQPSDGLVWAATSGPFLLSVALWCVLQPPGRQSSLWRRTISSTFLTLLAAAQSVAISAVISAVWTQSGACLSGSVIGLVPFVFCVAVIVPSTMTVLQTGLDSRRSGRESAVFAVILMGWMLAILVPHFP